MTECTLSFNVWVEAFEGKGGGGFFFLIGLNIILAPDVHSIGTLSLSQVLTHFMPAV